PMPSGTVSTSQLAMLSTMPVPWRTPVKTAAATAPRGVRVNLVAPGTVRTRAWDGRDDDLEALRRVYPLGRVGEPEDIAAAVTFLASRDASWITGTTLVVDGGITAVNSGFDLAVPRP
ncbi:SDR family oxidoreductase, partial [Streptomyces sp. NPDC004976]